MGRPEFERGGPGGGGMGRPVELMGPRRRPRRGAVGTKDWRAVGGRLSRGGRTCRTGRTGRGGGARCGGGGHARSGGDGSGRSRRGGAGRGGGSRCHGPGRWPGARGRWQRDLARRPARHQTTGAGHLGRRRRVHAGRGGTPARLGLPSARHVRRAVPASGAAAEALAVALASSSSGGWVARRRPSRSALRRTRSAWASSIEDEWLLTPIPKETHRSSASLFVRPSSRASS